MKVWWEMTIRPTASGAGTEFACRIGFDAPGWVTAAGTLVSDDYQLHQHLIEKTAGFARDIERKFG